MINVYCRTFQSSSFIVIKYLIIFDITKTKMSEVNRLVSFLSGDSMAKELASALNSSCVSAWSEISDICQKTDSQFLVESKINHERASFSFLNETMINEATKERAKIKEEGLENEENLISFGNLSVFLGDFLAASLAFSDVLKKSNFSDFSSFQKYLFSVVFSYYNIYDKTLQLLEHDYKLLPAEIYPDAATRFGLALRFEKRLNASLSVLTQVYDMQQTIISQNFLALQISETYLQLGKYVEGIRVLERFQNSLSLDSVIQYCFLMLLTDDEVCADNAIRLASNFPYLSQSIPLQYLTVRLMWKRNTIKDAIPLMSSIISNGTTDCKAWCTLGMIYTSNGQIEDAIKAFGMAVNCNPNMIEAWANIGALLELDHNLGDALEFYKKAQKKTNSPLFFQTRIDLLEKGIEHRPTMIEPNDKDYFDSPGKIQAKKFMSDTPKIPFELINFKPNPEDRVLPLPVLQNQIISEESDHI